MTLQQVASQLPTGVALPLMVITRSQHMALVASHPDASAPGFKPYDGVTEADVLGWVWGEIDKDAMQAKLAAKIAAAKKPCECYWHTVVT
jgi:hypothetical protein